MKPKRVLRMTTRAMMRERGLQPRSSNYTGERVTRGAKLFDVNFIFNFLFRSCGTVCELELVPETRAQDADWSRSVVMTDARAHGLYIFVAVGIRVGI